MSKAVIKICYRQIINASSKGEFEEKVFNDTYDEFLMQVQAYNQDNKFSTFKEVVAHNPKANSLHYKVGFAIGLYVKELDYIIPHLQDAAGHSHIRFSTHQLEIIQSDITNKSAHEVVIAYISDNLLLLASFGEYLLLAEAEKYQTSEMPAETFLLKMQPGLTISAYQEIEILQNLS